MLPQFPLVPARVKRMRLAAVPSATSRPPLAIVMSALGGICTVTPASIVSAAPLFIVTLPQTRIGLLVRYHVVLALINPLVQGGPLFVTSARSAIWIRSLLASVLFNPMIASTCVPIPKREPTAPRSATVGAG